MVVAIENVVVWVSPPRLVAAGHSQAGDSCGNRSSLCHDAIVDSLSPSGPHRWSRCEEGKCINQLTFMPTGRVSTKAGCARVLARSGRPDICEVGCFISYLHDRMVRSFLVAWRCSLLEMELRACVHGDERNPTLKLLQCNKLETTRWKLSWQDASG